MIMYIIGAIVHEGTNYLSQWPPATETFQDKCIG